MLIRRLLSALLVAIALTACAAAPAEPRGEHMLWKLSGTQNAIWLFGSVHLLREQDYPLAPAILDAYADADVLIMELDFDDLDELAMQRQVLEKSRMKEGSTLSAYMGEESYEKARELSQALGVNIDMFAYFEPWFAALTITTLELAKRGFVTDQGIETHFAKLAERDGKPITGLETAEFQLNIFDSMSPGMQRDLLLQSLEDMLSIDEEFEDVITAWRSGDSERLAELLLDGFENFPELYDALIVRRNTAWTEEILRRVDDGSDYMIIVGALHLAGDDSLLEMLRRRGVRARQF